MGIKTEIKIIIGKAYAGKHLVPADGLRLKIILPAGIGL